MNKEEYWNKEVKNVVDILNIFGEVRIINLRILYNCKKYLNNTTDRVKSPFCCSILILRVFRHNRRNADV